MSKLAPWVGGGLMCAALPASAQYSLEMADNYRTYSAPANRAPAPADRDYNLKLGPTEWSFAAGLSVGWTSNAQLSSSGNNSSSFIMAPTASANMYMPIAERTSLTLGISMGYSFYLNDTDSNLGGFYIAPSSQLGYTMYIGDVQLSFYDAMTVSQFAFDDPTVGAGNPDARTFSNAFGFSASTTLYKTQLTGGFTQNNSWQLGGVDGVGDTGSQNVFGQVGYQVLPELMAGINGGLTWMHYGNGNQTLIDGGFQWNVGPTINWTVTEQLNVNGSFGYTVYTQDYKFGLPSSDTGSMYWTLGLSHNASEFLTYSLSGGHTISPNYYSGPTDAYNVTLGLSWRLIRDVSISTPFSYYNGVGLVPETALTPGSQRFQSYSTGITFGYAFTRKLSGSLSYNFNYRTEEGPAGDYTVNGVTLGASYSF